MSGSTQNIGATLTGGIQDISALLPLLGTDQCEQHVGSALEGGFLYAAFSPVSIFGSLGIVKAGISVLVSTISITIPTKIISLRPFTMNFSRRQWLGAETLDNAGFKATGTVAPLIAMDGTRYKAETRLVEILEEKHLDNPENLSIKWKSRDWNIGLVLSTMGAAIMSGTPYIALHLQNSQPSLAHTSWIFPLLRTVGSCLAAVCCQFLIQSRVISLMKNRIIFMTMNRVVIDNLRSTHDKPELDLAREEHLQWDPNLPAEQCLWNLEQFLSRQSGRSDNSTNQTACVSDNKIARFPIATTPLPVSNPESSFTKPRDDPNGKAAQDENAHVPNNQAAHLSLDIKPLSFSDICQKLQEQYDDHFPSPAFDRAFLLISWITLCLSLPATIAGYIGCFTLVSNSQKNGPLVWLGVEAALSIIRILVWAWNPLWDEGTDITVKLKLAKEPPLVTTEQSGEVIKSTGDNTLALVPERRFLEWITPYTGPLDQFQSSEALFLYFTLTTSNNLMKKHLYMTLFDSNKRIAATLIQEKGVVKYIDATVTCNGFASEMEAVLQSTIEENHPWRTNDAMLFHQAAEYYKFITRALNQTPRHPEGDQTLPHPEGKHTQSLAYTACLTLYTATLPWKWSLLPTDKRNEPNNESSNTLPELPSLTEHDRLYLGRGYEHHHKTVLIEIWAQRINADMEAIRSDARNDCHHALADPASEKAKWELTELHFQWGWEWTRRELSLAVSSFALEGILREQMDKCIDEVTKEQGNGRLKEWMSSEFVIGQRKRLEKEREKRKGRMEKEMKATSARVEREGMVWGRQLDPQKQWEAGLKFIDKQWLTGIDGGLSASTLKDALSELDKMVKDDTLKAYSRDPVDDDPRLRFVKEVRQRFSHWHPQREYERREMDATIDRIREADGEHPDKVYRYPPPDSEATAKFVILENSKSQGKVCSATVYDVRDCDKDLVHDVIKKTTTRSVTGVDPALIDSILPNDHLLYIGSDSREQPAFVQQNRERWWGQQTGRGNSSTFYFTPQLLNHDTVSAWQGTIAHISIFLQTPSRLRLRLLHYREVDSSISIQEGDKELRQISADEISTELRLQEFKLDLFKPGKHKLQLVVTSEVGFYHLRDILVEILL